MAQQSVFSAELGFGIDDGPWLLSGDGLAGLAGLSTTAPIGSQYTDNLTGILYRKKLAGSGSDKWIFVLDEDSGASNDTSWREPAIVRDDTPYASLAAAISAMNGGTVDGVIVSDQDRILYTNITGENKNVYLVSGTPGVGAVLVEDTNLATNNDTIYVDNGTNAGKQYTYNLVADQWNQSNTSSLDEDGFIRSFIGKGATGSELPSYTSTIYVSNGDTLEAAIGSLDNQINTNATNIGTNTTGVSNLQTEVDSIETSLGILVNASGVYVPFSGTTYIDGNANLAEDLIDLDTAISTSATAASNAQAELDLVEAALGAMIDTSGNYSAFSGSNYMDAAVDSTGAMLALDAAIFANTGNITTNGTNISNLQTEVDNIETAFGTMVDSSGNYVTFSGTNYLDGNASVAADLVDLDTQIKVNADALTAIQGSTGDEAFIRAFIGKGATGSEVPAYSSANIITQGGSLEQTIGELDAAVDAIGGSGSTSIGAAGTLTLDTVLTTTAAVIKWIVRVKSGAVSNAVEILVVLNSTSSIAATDYDFNVSSVLKIGGKIPGIKYDIAIVGSDVQLLIDHPAATFFTFNRQIVIPA